MRYTVIWLPGARNALASLWVRSANRKALTAAANRIDRLLAVAPSSVGTVRGRRRRLVLPPLEIVYSVSPADRLVEVVYVAEMP